MGSTSFVWLDGAPRHWCPYAAVLSGSDCLVPLDTEMDAQLDLRLRRAKLTALVGSAASRCQSFIGGCFGEVKCRGIAVLH